MDLLTHFGCRVMAHISESNQTKLSDNSSLHYYVGPAPHTKQGILLYNPKTKLVIIRRSYQKLDTSDPVIPQISVDLSDPNVD